MASKQQKIRFLLRRHGQFGCTVSDTPGHCAQQVGPLVLKYTVMVECYHLDERQFVYAQEDLDTYFLAYSKEPLHLSCEALAAFCAKELREKVIASLGTEHVRVSVEISPPPYVGSAMASIGEAK